MPKQKKPVVLDIDDLSWVKAGWTRIKVLEFMYGGYKTPRDVAVGTGMTTNQASKTIKAMESRGIVECMTPDVKRGKLYQLTRKGRNLRKNL